ncbi:MAG TPA: cytochrome c biogenesis protein CcsA, partial [Geopsychrobacteraceae bacterium]|nr:cytochrome c biogenesis protein CcsA [Geopsychrobacteraceae bacterium]
MTSHIILFKITLIAYFSATVLYLVNVVLKHEKSGKFARWVLFCGIAIHFVNMALRFYEVRYTPVTDLHGSLSFFALCLVVLFLLFDIRYRLPVMGAFISPLALVLMIFAGIAHKPLLELNPILDSWWFPIHITFAFLGNAAFSLAFCAGVMYLLQNRMLKSKRFSALY